MEGAGAEAGNLQAKLIGGSNVLYADGPGALPRLGRENVESCRQALHAAGVDVVWEDVGGRMGRRVLVDLADFRVVVKLLERGLAGQ